MPQTARVTIKTAKIKTNASLIIINPLNGSAVTYLYYTLLSGNIIAKDTAQQTLMFAGLADHCVIKIFPIFLAA